MKKELQAFQQLLNIMDDLRAKCPWDKQQTMESLRHLTIEETYELADAILDNNSEEIKKELGDVLLHIVFYAKIASETNQFDITDVINSICEKLIYRHPHIYSDTVVKTEDEVKANWEKLKMKEGRTSVLEGVPNALPALVKAARIQEKVSAIGFDWEQPHQVWDKVEEEIEELKVEVDKNSNEKEAEFGDVLFALINYGKHIGVNAENALEKTNRKFISRFKYLEFQAKKLNKSLEDMTLKEMDIFWEEAKTVIK